MASHESDLPFFIDTNTETLPKRLREAARKPVSPGWPDLNRERLQRQADDIEASLRESEAPRTDTK